MLADGTTAASGVGDRRWRGKSAVIFVIDPRVLCAALSASGRLVTRDLLILVIAHKDTAGAASGTTIANSGRLADHSYCLTA